MGDPERYRKQDEVKKWEESDPIGIYRKHLVLEQVSDAELDEIDARVEVEISQSVEFAEASPEPGLEELFKDIYADADEGRE